MCLVRTRRGKLPRVRSNRRWPSDEIEGRMVEAKACPSPNHGTPNLWKQLSVTSSAASPEIWQCRAKRSSTTFDHWHFWFRSGWMVRVVVFPFSFVIGRSSSEALLGWWENPSVLILLSHELHLWPHIQFRESVSWWSTSHEQYKGGILLISRNISYCL